jgi:hypothetical protein
MRPYYRVWQFWQFLTARPLDEKAEAEIGRVLTPEQQQLFGRFSDSEQQHSYRVFSTLRAAGHDDPDLLAAALLHDIGKTIKPRYWWDKVLVVLGQAFLAGKTAEWAKGEAKGFRRPFVVKARHADWGADAAEAAQSSPITIALIRHNHHQSGEFDEKLKFYLPLLQGADDNN